MPAVEVGVAISGRTCALLSRYAIRAQDGAPRECQDDLADLVEAGNRWILSSQAHAVEFLTVREYAKKEHVCERTVRRRLARKDGAISGAYRLGNAWLIPSVRNS